jgi:hypothetical protein
MTLLRLCVACCGIWLVANAMNEKVAESIVRYVRGRYGESGVMRFEACIKAAHDLLQMEPR